MVLDEWGFHIIWYVKIWKFSTGKTLLLLQWHDAYFMTFPFTILVGLNLWAVTLLHWRFFRTYISICIPVETTKQKTNWGKHEANKTLYLQENGALTLKQTLLFCFFFFILRLLLEPGDLQSPPGAHVSIKLKIGFVKSYDLLLSHRVDLQDTSRCWLKSRANQKFIITIVLLLNFHLNFWAAIVWDKNSIRPLKNACFLCSGQPKKP